MTVRIIEKSDRHNQFIIDAWIRNYGGTTVVSRGHEFVATTLPGFVALDGERIVGALTWHREVDQVEVVSLDSFEENVGVGTALLETASSMARSAGVRRIWLITSNDNIRAIRFYQRRGWNLCALHVNAVEESRKIKPSIPLIGDDDIPVRHELEFEFVFRQGRGQT